MDFFTDAVRTLEILVQALSGKHSFYGTAADRSAILSTGWQKPKAKTVRVPSKHLRPPVRAQPLSALTS